MSPKKLRNLTQANYYQLRHLCESPEDQESHSEGPQEPSKATPEPSSVSVEDLTTLRTVRTILDLHEKGLLTASAAVHAIRELVRES